MNNSTPTEAAAPPLPETSTPSLRSVLGLGSNGLPVGSRLREFEIVKLIGEGGFGIVYLADDHILGRQVALKEFMPASLASRQPDLTVSVRASQEEPFQLGLKSFMNEARLLAQFDHPSLVRVYQFWEANGTAYMAMPYYRGTTLGKHLRDRRARTDAPPDEKWLRSLLLPLLEALETIHGVQCFHRDIAPDNILLLEETGKPLLLDFGSARRVIGDVTHALTAFVKPGFAPIEQYAQEDSMRQGPWTDVYALAATLYFAITAEVPINSTTRVLSDQLPSLYKRMKGRYSDSFLQAIDLGLAVRPQHRLQSVATWRALISTNLKLSQTGPHDIRLEETSPPSRPGNFASSAATPAAGSAVRPSGPPAQATSSAVRPPLPPTQAVASSASSARAPSANAPAAAGSDAATARPAAPGDPGASAGVIPLTGPGSLARNLDFSAIAGSDAEENRAAAERKLEENVAPEPARRSRGRWMSSALFALAVVLIGLSAWYALHQQSAANAVASNAKGGPRPAAAAGGAVATQEGATPGSGAANGQSTAAAPAGADAQGANAGSASFYNCDAILHRAISGERVTEPELVFLENHCAD